MIVLLSIAAASVAIVQTPGTLGPLRSGAAPGDSPRLPGEAWPPVPLAAPQFIYAPIVSNIDRDSGQLKDFFVVSWVGDQRINASVEACVAGAGCSSADLSAAATFFDSVEFLATGAAYVQVIASCPIAPCTHYYRAVAQNQTGGVTYYPPTSPYPSVLGRTADIIGGSNPTFNVHPYRDADDSGTCGAADSPAPRFLGYLNHTGTLTIASRGLGVAVSLCGIASTPDWTIQLSTSRLRNDNAPGSLHPISSGESVSLFVAGLLSDGVETNYWSNASAYTWTSGNPVLTSRLSRGAVVVPESGALALLVVGAAVVVPIASVHGPRPRRARTGGGPHAPIFSR